MRPLPQPVVIPARAAPAPSAASSPDTVSVFPAPAPAAPRRSRAPLAIAAACAVVGFGAGFAATRGKLLPDLFREDVAERQPAPAIETPSAPVRTSDAAAASPAQEPAPDPEARAAPTAPSKPARAAAERKPPARRVAAVSAGKGFIVVTAPAEAEVLLDGKRIGKGDVRREIEVGAHRVEVRLGAASVTERFTVVRGETWTYDVTPTVN
ncbi:MAG TPA: PEGA domain-containing protein [Anaeromyxobacter sp.]|nr:PEGA domain-containing protein [Anaeromyxobacter sp.]